MNTKRNIFIHTNFLYMIDFVSSISGDQSFMHLSCILHRAYGSPSAMKNTVALFGHRTDFAKADLSSKVHFTMVI